MSRSMVATLALVLGAASSGAADATGSSRFATWSSVASEHGAASVVAEKSEAAMDDFMRRVSFVNVEGGAWSASMEKADARFAAGDVIVQLRSEGDGFVHLQTILVDSGWEREAQISGAIWSLKTRAGKTPPYQGMRAYEVVAPGNQSVRAICFEPSRGRCTMITDLDRGGRTIRAMNDFVGDVTDVDKIEVAARALVERTR